MKESDGEANGLDESSWARFDKRKAAREWLREQEKKGSVPVIEAKPHRCNERLEDVVKGVWTSPVNVWRPLMTFWKCVWSREGFALTLFIIRYIVANVCAFLTDKSHWILSAIWRLRFDIVSTTTIVLEKSALIGMQLSGSTIFWYVHIRL
jgi:hypothetical protein